MAKYKYTVKTKGVFSRDLTSTADSKEEIEAAISMTITDGTWIAVENGKKGFVEDKWVSVTIEKIKK